jgi:serine/threonine protein kinase
MEMHPGAVIAGRYRVDHKIGAGGMGEVWAGEHVNIGVRVALKTLLPAAALDRHLVARFRREAQLLGRLRSDRIARVVDFVEDRDLGLVLVMDFVEGEVLSKVLADRQLSLDEVIDLGVDIVTALRDLHRAKVVHRDIKPDNIILEPLPDGRRRAVIVDLGVSRLDAGPSSEEVTSITQVDMAVGTLPYMAPEQLLSSSTATASADVYAVGAILYRAVSGEQVFGNEDDAIAARRKIAGEAPPLPMQRADRVAVGLSAVVARALRRRPEERFGSAEEMQSALAALQDVSRTMTLEIDDETTEEGPPPSVPVAVPSASPRARQTSPGPPPVASSPSRPALEAAVSDEASGESTWRMSRPPVESLGEEATQLSLASRALLQAEAVAAFARPAAEASPASEVSAMSRAPATSRPTVPSPVLIAAAPHPLLAPAPPAESSEGSPESLRISLSPAVDDPARARTISVRLAALGLIAALAAGTALGFEAHRLLAPDPTTAAPPQR